MSTDSRAEFEAWCLFCDKAGHRTEECHSTHGLNTPKCREIDRLAQAALATKAAPEPTPPQAPLRRGSTGVCSRSTCLCEQEQLGDQCIWLRPTDAALEAATGEPHIDGWPLYSGLPPTQAPEEVVQRLMTLADDYADGPHTEGYFGALRDTLQAALQGTLDAALTTQAAEVARLTAEVERLRKDERRYQWLRSRVPGGTYRIMGVIYSDGGAGVDAAIDAAMAAELGGMTNG